MSSLGNLSARRRWGASHSATSADGATTFVLVSLCVIAGLADVTAKELAQTWHFAANANFGSDGSFVPSKAGFNLGDVSSKRELDLLPEGTKGLVWVGQCDGVTARFESAVGAVIDHPRTFGFYLMDDPDPRGRWRPQCKASDLRAESDWIHSRRSDAITFVALMNVGTSAKPEFDSEYRPEISHIDLFGVSPYPCRTEWSWCDYEMIDRFVRASESAGIPADRVVPTFQTFGGGDWRTDSGGRYRLPSYSEMLSMLERWDKFVPTPVFDYAYSWGSQRSDESLAASLELQSAFIHRNRDSRASGARP